MKTLLIVESPSKVKTIEKLLGSNYVVRASFGHIRDLDKKDFGVDIENNFKPNYILMTTRAKQIKELKDMSKNVDKIFLASDEDKEGEAIAWHVAVILKMDLSEKNRICFHEITKKALENAVANPRKVDMAMVNSQQARRILDRIVGFSLSPLLWKYIAPNLSGGRVQSVCLKLTIEKEEDIDKFNDKKYFKTKGIFENDLEGFLNKKFESKEEVMDFLEKCKSSVFTIRAIEKSVSEKNPPPAFITSSIQQDAGTRYGMSSKKIMSVLQKLYESGLISYHRTDNVNLSTEFIDKIENYVTEKFGANYFKKRIYKSKVKCAQEAHEAIRPTNINTSILDDDYDAYEKKIYNLIWKRTIASQMSKAVYDVYKVFIALSNSKYEFVSTFEKLVFEGYKKIYEDFVPKKNENDEEETKTIKDEKILNKIKENATIPYKTISALEKYMNPPSRFSEATLIKKMEVLGIGRPSTYSNIINTLLERKYITVENIEGAKKDIINYILEKNDIKQEPTKISIGSEKKKMLPTQLGKNTCKFLTEHFIDLMDYKFTSNLEEKLDDVANDKIIWNVLLKDFYNEFHPIVNKLQNVKYSNDDNKDGANHELTKYKNQDKRFLGLDKNNKNVYAYVGKFGPVLQFVDNDDATKTVFQKLEDFDVKTVELKDLDKIETYPKDLGVHEDGQHIYLKKGKFGLYIEHNKTNYKILDEFKGEDNNGENISIKDALKCMTTKKTSNLHDFGEYIVKEGQYGPYIIYDKKFFKIPRSIEINKLTKKDCIEIVKNDKDKPKTNYKDKYKKNK